MGNVDEIAFWDGPAGTLWTRYAARMDRAFAPFDAPSIALANARVGESILDVGCGAGSTSLALANHVGPSGLVDGVDVSHEMLALARERARLANVANVRFTRADAADDTLGHDAFDLVFSRFGVMFFDDPSAAFANLLATLKPGGRIAFACWRDLRSNPWFSVPLFAVRDHAPPQPKADPLAPGPMAFADAERLRSILQTARFRDIAIEPFDASLPLGSRAEAVDTLSQIGPAARFLDLVLDRAVAMASLELALAKHERDGVVSLGGGIWLVSARR